MPPDTNIVMLDLPAGVDAMTIVEAARAQDVLIAPWSKTRIRAVFHLEIDDAGAQRAGDIVARALERAG